MIDSASTVNAVQIGGAIASGIANVTGNMQTGSIVSQVVTVVVALLSFIFGHSHGKRSK